VNIDNDILDLPPSVRTIQ